MEGDNPVHGSVRLVSPVFICLRVGLFGNAALNGW